MKNILIVIMSLILCVSCAENKTFIKKDGTSFTASPYGWFNKESRIDGVVYEVNKSNLILDVIFCETVVLPIVLTGTELYEPINYNE